jgi:hypothetical protein
MAAGSLSTYSANKLLDHVCSVAAYTPVATVYLALHTSSPGEGGSLAAEVSGNNYSRIAITFSAASGRAIANSAQLTFPTSSASWGTITSWSICDASTAGNVLAYSDFAASKAIGSGVAPRIAASALTITFNANNFSTYLAHKLLDLMFRNTAYSAPTIYCAFTTASVTDASTGATITEPVGNAYARKQVTGGWATASAGATQNNAAITFATPTGAWGTLTHQCALDSVTAGAGNVLFWTDVTDFAPLLDEPVEYPIGAYDITLT